MIILIMQNWANVDYVICARSLIAPGKCFPYAKIFYQVSVSVIGRNISRTLYEGII